MLSAETVGVRGGYIGEVRETNDDVVIKNVLQQ